MYRILQTGGQYIPDAITFWVTLRLLYTIGTFIGAIWLLWRAYQVLKRPTEELIEVLGIEVPEAPNVSLIAIEEESVRLKWSKPIPQDTVVKYYVLVNGCRVGESSRTETSIDVTGLEPNSLYGIKVIAVNASKFEAASQIIRVQTLPRESTATSDPNGDLNPSSENVHVLAGKDDDSSTVRPHNSQVETTPSVSTAPCTVREHSGSHSASRRSGPGRRHSPANNPADQTSTSQSPLVQGLSMGDGAGSEETVEQLTAKFEALRADYEESERLIEEENREHEISQAALLKERDELKQTLKDKEEQSAELRKTAANLDSASRAAQRKKAAKERELQQKKDERKKMEDDIVRWRKEREEMRADRERMEKEKEEIEASTKAKHEEIHQAIDSEQKKVKELEESIKTIGTAIKEHEETRRKQESDGDDEEGRAQHAERMLQGEARLRALQAQYTTKSHACQQAKADYQRAMDSLGWWQNQYAANPSQFAPLPFMDADSTASRNKQRRSRHRKSRTNTAASPIGAVTVSESSHTGTPALSSVASTSPSYTSPSPFFNMSNGMSFVTPPEHTGHVQTDNDTLTSGGPLSPSATALLPSNLLGDDEPPSPQSHSSHNVSVSFGSRNAFDPRFSSLDNTAYGPNSPESPLSQDASAFASPRESFSNLRNYPSGSDGPLNGDRRSIHSNAGSFGALETIEPSPVGSRFAGLFGLSRQRGKTIPNEPPQLGSLKAGQSQSVPRNSEPEETTLDPIGTRRRRGSHSGNWANPMASLLNRSVATGNDVADDNAPAPSRVAASRRRPFNMFSSKFDPLEPSKLLEQTSSRPSSSHSRDNSLPRPSSDSQPFGWPATEAVGHRSSPLGPDWSAPEVWSRTNSRRQSMQYGSTTSLPIGMSPLEAEALHNKLLKQTSPPAPIGTRQRTRPETPKLNPAAPSFKTIFGRSDAKKAEKAAEKERKESELLPEEASPPDPRRSRDSRSINTQDSLAESHDSLDRSTSGTPSESLTPSGKDKESLIQKITRKSSSSKFNIPWKDKGGLFSKKAGEPSTPGEIDEDGVTDNQLGKGADSSTSSPQVGSGKSGMHWSSLMRKTKKGSEKASEAGDDEDE
ncbi:MAG: hypothetical protein M1835_007753 [Candelina submexicana]|nr:MAG: hypothetical protein M1835_007753 [Candelina submexicana]